MTNLTVAAMFWLSALSPFEPVEPVPLTIHCVERDMSNSGHDNSWALEYCEEV